MLARTLLALFLLPVLTTATLADDAAPGTDGKSVYLIGNSLTWDTVPSRLDGDVQWHVDCGKNLPFIHANPEEPCVKSSTLWPRALVKKQYDLLCVQPHYRSTLDEDVATISKWIEMQPRAVVVVHTGWAHHEKRVEEYADDDPAGPLTHSRAYFEALTTRLRAKYPKREFRSTRAIELLAKVAEDVAAERAPIGKVADLHRDAIHLTNDGGRYLMHNAMRRAIGQPASTNGFEKTDPKLRSYLDGVLASLDE